MGNNYAINDLLCLFSNLKHRCSEYSLSLSRKSSERAEEKTKKEEEEGEEGEVSHKQSWERERERERKSGSNCPHFFSLDPGEDRNENLELEGYGRECEIRMQVPPEPLGGGWGFLGAPRLCSGPSRGLPDNACLRL